MMKYYQEITLIGQSEIPLHFILSKVYVQIHLALVEMQDENGIVPIGVSFPEYLSSRREMGVLNKSDDGNRKIGLGTKVRLFSETEDVLKQLDLSKWLAFLTDYVHSTGIREIPLHKITGYANFKRKHIKGSLQNLSKRYAKRNSLSIEEAEKHFNKVKDSSNLPYLQLKSLSEHHPFRLVISKVKCESLINEGFGTYGLSSVSTVPEF